MGHREKLKKMGTLVVGCVPERTCVTWRALWCSAGGVVEWAKGVGAAESAGGGVQQPRLGDRTPVCGGGG